MSEQKRESMKQIEDDILADLLVIQAVGVVVGTGF